MGVKGAEVWEDLEVTSVLFSRLPLRPSLPYLCAFPPVLLFHRMPTSIASLTGRGPAGSDGLFTMRPLTTIVVEPPPSRLSASVSLRRSQRRWRSANVMPTLYSG